MADMSNYLENALLNHALGTSALTAPANVYVKLHTGDPGEDCTANPSANTTRVVAAFNAAAAGVAGLSASLTWAAWAAGAETITHVSLWDNLTVGNPLFKGALTASKAVTNGDDFVLDAYDITFD